MKPPLEIKIDVLTQRDFGVFAYDYEVERLKAISAGETVKFGDALYRSDTLRAIVDAVYQHTQVPPLTVKDKSTSHASFIWDPVPDLWIYTRDDSDYSINHFKSWWDEDDTFDRHVMRGGDKLTLHIKVIWEAADETTA